jgi:hypothetical protein
MRHVRWLGRVGRLVCLCSWLCAPEPWPPLWAEWAGPCPAWSEPDAPPEFVLRFGAEAPGPVCHCLAAPPEAAPAAPHWHGPAHAGGANLVVEVPRLELTDAFGCPRGTFR